MHTFPRSVILRTDNKTISEWKSLPSEGETINSAKVVAPPPRRRPSLEIENDDTMDKRRNVYTGAGGGGILHENKIPVGSIRNMKEVFELESKYNLNPNKKAEMTGDAPVKPKEGVLA